MLTHEVFESLLPLTAASRVASCNQTAISVQSYSPGASCLALFSLQKDVWGLVPMLLLGGN